MDGGVLGVAIGFVRFGIGNLRLDAGSPTECSGGGEAFGVMARFLPSDSNGYLPRTAITESRITESERVFK
jgi:hypothetical protein